MSSLPRPFRQTPSDLFPKELHLSSDLSQGLFQALNVLGRGRDFLLWRLTTGSRRFIDHKRTTTVPQDALKTLGRGDGETSAKVAIAGPSRPILGGELDAARALILVLEELEFSRFRRLDDGAVGLVLRRRTECARGWVAKRKLGRTKAGEPKGHAHTISKALTLAGTVSHSIKGGILFPSSSKANNNLGRVR